MNNPQITAIYGLYNQDGSGYNSGKAIAFYPIKAAAEAAQNGNYYLNVCKAESLRFEDTLYLYKKTLDRKSIKGCVKAFIPTLVYQDYSYNSYYSRDESVYYTDKDSLIELLNDGKQHVIYALWLICDTDDNYHLLVQPEPITVEKIVMSRELAINHALSKLTDEEKKLLGL